VTLTGYDAFYRLFAVLERESTGFRDERALLRGERHGERGEQPVRWQRSAG
jgi:hypothetical protein